MNQSGFVYLLLNMKTKFAWAWVVLGLVGCGSEPRIDPNRQWEHPKPHEMQKDKRVQAQWERSGHADEQGYSVAGNAEWDLAKRFLRYQMEREPDDSWAFSPTSISLCATMLREGLVGQTEKDLAKALGQTQSLEVVRKDYQRMRKNIAAYPDVLKMAQAIFMRKDDPPREAFVTNLKEHHDAEVQLTNFPQPGLQEINDWGKKNTDGMVPKVLEELDSTTFFVLVQATLFKGSWVNEFDPQETKPAPFFGPRGKTKCQLMRQEGEFRYTEGKGFQALMLPYHENFSMVIVLPSKGSSMRKVLDNPEAMRGLRSSTLYRRNGTVFLPKWVSEVNLDLIPAFKEWGAKSLFQASADFSPITAEAMWVSQIRQATKIEVDEKGTRAAAVSAIATEAGEAIEPPKPFTFRADRPFLYAILTPTLEPLFVGVLNNPNG